MYKFIPIKPIELHVIEHNNQPVTRSFERYDENNFVLNKFGHIRSDFAVLMESNSSAEMAKVLSKMQADFVSGSSRYDGMTFEEIVASYKPRWCQMPGEVDRFEQYLIDNALDFYKKLKSDIDDDTKQAIKDALDKQAAEPVPAPTE